MNISAATSFAQTVLAYFSPTKSPYYSVIAFATTALAMSAPISMNWEIIFFPIVMLLFYCNYLSIFDRPDFEEKEYDDQIKFSRAFSLSSAVLCLVFVGLKIEPDKEALVNNWHFWVGYLTCISQVSLFCIYAYVYANLQTKPVSRNFVQLALITSTYLIGLTYANIAYDNASPDSETRLHFLYLLITLCLLWLSTMLVWLIHLKKSIVFKFITPEDAKSKNG